MTWQGITGLLIFGAIAILAIWDAIVYNISGYDATITNVVVNLTKNWPILTFAAGVICGHFWFPTLVTGKEAVKKLRKT